MLKTIKVFAVKHLNLTALFLSQITLRYSNNFYRLVVESKAMHILM